MNNFLTKRDIDELCLANALDRATKCKSGKDLLITYYPTIELICCGICYSHALARVLSPYNDGLIENLGKKEKVSPTIRHAKVIWGLAKFLKHPKYEHPLFIETQATNDLFNNCIDIKITYKYKNNDVSTRVDYDDYKRLGPNELTDVVILASQDILTKLNYFVDDKE